MIRLIAIWIALMLSMTANAALNMSYKTNPYLKYFGFFGESFGPHSSADFIMAQTGKSHLLFIGSSAGPYFNHPCDQRFSRIMERKFCYVSAKLDDLSNLSIRTYNRNMKAIINLGEFFFITDPISNVSTPVQEGLLLSEASNIINLQIAHQEAISMGLKTQGPGPISEVTMYKVLKAFHTRVFLEAFSYNSRYIYPRNNVDYYYRRNMVAAFYVLDEPYLGRSSSVERNVRYGELNSIGKIIKNQRLFPGTKTALAFSASETNDESLMQFLIPGVDWIGMDCYHTCSFDTTDTNKNINALYKKLKSKKKYYQKLFVVPEIGFDTSEMPGTKMEDCLNPLFSGVGNTSHLPFYNDKLIKYYNMAATDSDFVGFFPFMYGNFAFANNDVRWCGGKNYPLIVDTLKKINNQIY